MKKLIATLLASFALAAQASYITGAGATFPYPIYAKWAEAYMKETGIGLNYQSIGSSGGIRQINAKTVAFGASDAPVSGENLEKLGQVQFPAIIGGTVPVVNLEGFRPGELRITGTVLADIYLGNISRWNDAKLVALNPGKKLPDEAITVVHRADGSGTTNNFTRWLNGVAPSVWTKPANDAFTTAFPGNINATGNIGRIVGANQSQGIATLAAKTKYSITYAEKNWGDAYGLRAAYVGNAAGNFIYPDSGAVSAFLGEASQNENGIVTYDYGTKIAGAYTLGIISYMLVETSYADKARGAAVKQLAEYILSPACSAADPKLGYVVVSGTFLDKAKAQIAKMNK